MTGPAALRAHVARWLTEEDGNGTSAGPSGGPLARVTSWARRHPKTVDAVLALALAGFTVPQLRYWAQQPTGLTERLALTALLVLPLVWRRRFPVAVFAFAAAVALVQWSLSISLAADVVLLVYLYTVASRYPSRVAVTAAAVLELGVILAAVRWNLAGDLAQPLLMRVVYLSGPVAVALLLGISVRARRQSVIALTERADQLERERGQQVAIAAAAERARIAREMHDVVAHGLSVMVTLSDAAALKAPGDAQGAAATMRQVSATGRQALGEMRGLLGVLRSDSDHDVRHPAPGMAELPDLVDGVRSAGLDAELHVAATPPSVSAALQLTVHRIVQESLTNTLAHAVGATRVDVAVDVAADAITVQVADDGTTPSRSSSRSGLGLVGMRERAAVHGGTVSAGPGPTGGWLVQAHLPRAADSSSRLIAVDGTP